MKPISLTLLVFALFLAACGPSPEEQAAPTITATPNPIASPTPDIATLVPTLSPTPEPTPTPEPEQIGGSAARIMWGDWSFHSPKDGPNRFDYLTPTAPEQWEQLKEELKLDTGDPVPLGKVLTYYGTNIKVPIVPGLIRDVVLLDGLVNGQPYYAVVLEFPANKTAEHPGGSIFYVFALMQAFVNKDYSTATLSDTGYPAACAGGATCSYDQVVPSLSDLDRHSDQELIPMYSKMVGHMALFGLHSYNNIDLVHDIAEGSLPDTSQNIILSSPPGVWFPNIAK